jgi:hypothetical protein
MRRDITMRHATATAHDHDNCRKSDKARLSLSSTARPAAPAGDEAATFARLTAAPRPVYRHISDQIQHLESET